jgi:hypothetical protein
MAIIRGFIVSILMVTTFISTAFKSPFDGTKPIYPQSSDVNIISSTVTALDDTCETEVFTNYNDWREWYTGVYNHHSEYHKYNDKSFFDENNLVVITVGRATIYKLYIKSITEVDDTLKVDCGAYLTKRTSEVYTYTGDRILITTSKNISQADVSYDHVRTIAGL